MPQRRDARQRLRDIEWALQQQLEPRELVRMLEKLLAEAAPGSTEESFATLKLAELLVATEPWRAAVLAKRSLVAGERAHAWAVLGLAQSALGHFRASIRAYRRALLLVPENPWYCHNLGHLLDVAFNRPSDALVYLERAYAGQPAEPEIASSLAHALARTGQVERARVLLTRATGSDQVARDWLERWRAPRRSPMDEASNSRFDSVGPSIRNPSRG